MEDIFVSDCFGSDTPKRGFPPGKWGVGGGVSDDGVEREMRDDILANTHIMDLLSTDNDNKDSQLMGGVPPVGGGGSGTETGSGTTTGREDMGTQTPTPFLSFSPKTCLEILPTLTDDQLEHETSYFKSVLGPVQAVNIKSSTRKSPAGITRCLTRELLQDTDRLTDNISKIDILNDNIFILFEKAEKMLSDITSMSVQDSVDSLSHTLDHILDSDPVSVLNCKIDTTVENCTEGVSFTKLGNREVDYFGLCPYHYGHSRHEPKPYPKSNFFSDICNLLNNHDPDFNLETYTCLVTRYRDGDSDIAPHSDNEACILSDSNIYTVSVGADRTLDCRNKLGEVTICSYPLTDGSIYKMSRDSQNIWEHSIPAVKSCNSPRISFTFRKIDPTYKPAPLPPIPPIKEFVSVPEKQKPKPKRVLFITDSILSGFPVNLFNDSDIMCIKKLPTCRLLSNIDSFEREFRYTDYVVISAGINDLSRYGYTGVSLGSFVSDRIRHWAAKYPKTVFVFNSLLRTYRGAWLNQRVETVNRIMFDLSVELYESNYWFFDSHAALAGMGTQFPIISPMGNGIHISYDACQYLSRAIVQALKAFDAGSSILPRVWPLRTEYRRLISGSLHPRYRMH